MRGWREWYAVVGDQGYRIKESQKSDPATRTVNPLYLIGITAFRPQFGIASKSLGTAPTLKEAKAIAQQHADGGGSP
jgi:hypothetical protein